MRFQVRDTTKGDFHIESVEVVESKTRAFIAKAVVITGLGLTVAGMVYAMVIEGEKSAEFYMAYANNFVCLVIGHYFGKSKK